MKHSVNARITRRGPRRAGNSHPHQGQNKATIEPLERRVLWSVSFTAPQETTTVPSANSAAVADFNGDGRLDIAVAGGSSTDARLGISLGNGDGTFTAPLVLATGHFPDWVAAADFNGDGKTDVAVGEVDDGTVGVFLGNGDGTFQSRRATRYGTAPAPDSGYSVIFAVADFNRDGKPDLAVADEANHQLVTMLGKGDGTFTAHPDDFYGAPIFPIAADFNGDGIADISYNTSLIRLGNGDGSFQSPLFSPAGEFTTLNSTAVGDFNGDGRPDLAGGALGFLPPDGLPTDFSEPVQVQLGNGDGTLQDPVILSDSIDTASANVVTGDFNGDGRLDLASTAGGTIDAFEGNGDGTFQQGLAFLQSDDHFGRPVAGDFNGDGRADLALTGAGPSGDAVAVLLATDNPGDVGGVGSGSGGGSGAATLTPSITGSVPTYIVAGSRIKAKVLVAVAGSGDAVVADPVTVRLYVSTDASLGDDDTMIASVAKKLKLKKGKSKVLKFDVSRALAGAAPATYFILAKMSDASGATAIVTLGQQTIVAAPFIDLSGAVATAAGTKFIQGKTTSLVIDVANTGNVTASGSVSVAIAAGAGGAPSSDDQAVATVATKVKVSANSHRAIKLKFRLPTLSAAGDYYFLATLTPGKGITDSDLTNNVLVSAGPYTIA